MDLATILSRVDSRQYEDAVRYLADVRLIEHGTRQYYGSEPGGEGARLVTQASALYDEAEGLLRSGLPEELRQRLLRMRGAGGPAAAPPGTVTVEALAAEAIAAAARGGHHHRGGQSHGGGREAAAGGSQRASGRLKGDGLPTSVRKKGGGTRCG